MRRGRFPSGLTSGSAGPSAHCLPLLDSSPTQMGSLHTPVSTCRPWLWLGSVSPLTSAARSQSQNEKTKTKQPGTLLHCFLIASGGRHPGTGVGTSCRGQPAFRHSTCAVVMALPGTLHQSSWCCSQGRQRPTGGSPGHRGKHEPVFPLCGCNSQKR